MSSLSDLAELVGFFSYSRDDDEGSDGNLSRLRSRIQEELRAQLGRSRHDLRLWQDKSAIAHGKLWEAEIKTAIADSVFFIPIVTPTAVRSSHCKIEFDAFLAREAALGRSDLVFPIHYIRVPQLEDEGVWRDNPLLSIIGARQYIDWLRLRHLDVGSTEVRVAVEGLCANIVRALQQRWVSPEAEQAAAEARRLVEAEERRAAEVQQAEEARQAEAQRQADEKRHADERWRQAEQTKQAEIERRAADEYERQVADSVRHTEQSAWPIQPIPATSNALVDAIPNASESVPQGASSPEPGRRDPPAADVRSDKTSVPRALGIALVLQGLVRMVAVTTLYVTRVGLSGIAEDPKWFMSDFVPAIAMLAIGRATVLGKRWAATPSTLLLIAPCMAADVRSIWMSWVPSEYFTWGTYEVLVYAPMFINLATNAVMAWYILLIRGDRPAHQPPP